MLNICIFEGRLTRDPDIKKTASGLTIANFTIAVDRNIKKEGKPTALFLPCTFFGNQAENIAKYFKKGRAIIVSGRVEQDKFFDKYTNTEKEQFYLAGERFDFPLESGGSKKQDQDQPQENETSAIGFAAKEGGEQEKAVDSLDIVDDDLPF